MLKKSVLLAALMALVCSTALAADKLEGRSRLELKMGSMSVATNASAEVDLGGVAVDYGNSGFLGGIGYGRWMQEDLAVDFSVAALSVGGDVDVSILNVSTSTVVVTQIRLGLRKYFPKGSLESSVRPYVAVGAGPVFAHVTQTKVSGAVASSARTETAFGGHLGAGVDIITSRKIMLGASGGYNFQTDFSEELGGRDNYGGPEFALSFSILFGKVKE